MLTFISTCNSVFAFLSACCSYRWWKRSYSWLG